MNIAKTQLQKLIAKLRNPNVMTLGIFGFSTGFLQLSRMVAEITMMGVMSPVLFGYWKLWQLIAIYAPILHLGVPNGAYRNIPFFRGERNDSRLMSTISTSFTVGLIASILAGVLAYLIAQLSIGNHLISHGQYFPFSLAAFVFLSILFFTSLGFLRSLEEFRIFSVIQMIAALIIFLGIMLVIKFQLIGFLAILSVAYGTGALYSIYRLRKYIGFEIQIKELKELIVLGLPILLVGFMYSFFTTLDRVLISIVKGADFVGEYSLAILVFGTLSFVPLLLSNFYYPKITRTFGATASYNKAFQLAKQQSILSAGITLAVTICVGLLLPFLVTNFIPDYSVGIMPAYFIMPGLIGLSIIGGFANFLNAIKKQMVYLQMQGIAILLSVMFSACFFYMGMGISGIALGTSCSYIVYAILLLQKSFVLSKDEPL